VDRVFVAKRQQCRTSFALKFRPFDKVERCFGILGKNVQASTALFGRCC